MIKFIFKNYLLLIFILLFSLGQAGSIRFQNNIVIYLHEVFMLIFLITFFVKRRKLISVKNININKYKYKEYLIFIFVSFVSLLIALFNLPFKDVLVGSLYLLRYIYYFVFSIGFVSYFKNKSDIYVFLYLSSLFILILGFLQLILYPSLQNLVYIGWDPHHFRLFSTFLDPNFVAIYLLLGFILGFKFIDNKIVILTQLMLIIGIFLTYSRSTYVALAACLIIYFILSKKFKIMLLSVFILFGVIYFFPRIKGDTLRLDRIEATEGRLKSIKWGIGMFQKSPMFGYGFSTLRYLDRPSELENETLNSHSSSGVDNSFLFILLTSGIIGLISYLYIIYKQIFIYNLSLFSQKLSKISLITKISLIAVLVDCLFINSLFYPWIMLWIFITSEINRIEGLKKS